MKFTKKFYDDLHKIGEDAFIEKNMWIGKLVPEIIVDNLQKRGISQEDVEDCVVLSIEEAKAVTDMLKGDLDYYHYKTGQIHYPTVKLIDMLENRLKQVEMSIAST